MGISIFSAIYQEFREWKWHFSVTFFFPPYNGIFGARSGLSLKTQKQITLKNLGTENCKICSLDQCHYSSLGQGFSEFFAGLELSEI